MSTLEKGCEIRLGFSKFTYKGTKSTKIINYCTVYIERLGDLVLKGRFVNDKYIFVLDGYATY